MPYVCPVCNKSFNTSFALEGHLLLKNDLPHNQARGGLPPMRKHRRLSPPRCKRLSTVTRPKSDGYKEHVVEIEKSLVDMQQGHRDMQQNYLNLQQENKTLKADLEALRSSSSYPVQQQPIIQQQPVPPIVIQQQVPSEQPKPKPTYEQLARGITGSISDKCYPSDLNGLEQLTSDEKEKLWNLHRVRLYDEEEED